MGALTLRLRGVYFAISTLSLSVVLETLVVNWPYVGGSSGAYLIRPKVFAPFTTYTEYLCLTMFAISAGAAVASAAIERSSLGAGLAAIRDDETAAAALGVPTLRLKLVAATISGAILGMTGAPLPFYNSYLNPDSAFAIGYSVNAIAMALVGGAQSWLGPVAGALLLGSLQQLALAFVSSSASLALTGLVFIVFVALAPQGLIGLVSGPRARGRRPVSAPLLRLQAWASASAASWRSPGSISRLSGGERLGLIGPNGSGKSTFVNCLGRRLRALRGRDRIRRLGARGPSSISASKARARPHISVAARLREPDGRRKRANTVAFPRR